MIFRIFDLGFEGGGELERGSEIMVKKILARKDI